MKRDGKLVLFFFLPALNTYEMIRLIQTHKPIAPSWLLSGRFWATLDPGSLFVLMLNDP